jgi:muconolactone delta-isomerase
MFKRWFNSFVKPTSTDTTPIIIVSGLPRSGTSLMMKMLQAGGMPLLVDHLRTADEDNPQGYYEYEPVKQLDKGQAHWLPEAQGKAVKVISALLPHLPLNYHYRVIFMQRHLAETLASQHKMLQNRGEVANLLDDEQQVTELFQQHLQEIHQWLAQQPNFQQLNVDYNELLAHPQPAVRAINRFLGSQLDEQQMIGAIDPSLYRNRRGR